MCLVSTIAFGQSTEIVYSRGDSAMTVGTGITKAETFDLCQCLDDKALVGMRVKALRITFPLVNGLSDGQAWMSTQLPTIKSMKMQPVDIATKEFTPQRGYHEVGFDEPIRLSWLRPRRPASPLSSPASRRQAAATSTPARSIAPLGTIWQANGMTWHFR